MDLALLAMTAACGVAVGLVAGLAFRATERAHAAPGSTPVVPAGIMSVLAVLPSQAVLLDGWGNVVKASSAAHAYGLVRAGRLAAPELAAMVEATRRDGLIREEQLEVARDRKGEATMFMQARVAPLGAELVLLLVEDRTEARRLESIRQDFVANVSHELKTPVGALNLLAEAVAEAADDPEAVQRFSSRMRIESERLTRLVQQIIELSRLQGDDPLDEVDPLPVAALAERAIDRVRVDAADKQMTVTFVGDDELAVMGNAEQLVVALGNLVENAVAYSDTGTRVTVAARSCGERVEIIVTDHGIGIPSSELDRIFERFYRVDPARARATGGTGLGLSIVKHVATTHAGEVRVWSVEGEGSTFTLALPAYVERPVGPLPVPSVVGAGASLPAHSTSEPQEVV